MENIFENWRKYQEYNWVFEDPEYITEVLGIKLPLNESGEIVYSIELKEQIIAEAQWVQNLKNKAKELYDEYTGPARNFARVMYDLASGKERPSVFMQALNSNIIKPLSQQLMKLLYSLPEFMGLKKLGRRIWDNLQKRLINPARQQGGARGVLNFSGLAILLRLALQYVKTKVAQFAKFITPGKDIIDSVKENVKELATQLKDKFATAYPDIFTKIASAGAKGLGAAVQIFVAIYKSMTKVGELLAPAIDSIASRSRGEDHSSTLSDEDKIGYFASNTYKRVKRTSTRAKRATVPNKPEFYGPHAGKDLNDAEMEQLKQIGQEYINKKARTIGADDDDDDEVNESMSPEDIITDKYSYNSAKTSQHRWSPGQPIVDYSDTPDGRVYTITFPDGTDRADFWPTQKSEPGEDLDAFLSRTKNPVQLNLALDPEVIKMIEETTQNVLEIPISKMYASPSSNGTHITVQLNTDSREHASNFTRLVQNHWTSSGECVKLEKMGYKVHITTIDREDSLTGILITQQIL
jgi:hypothetical protein